MLGLDLFWTAMERGAGGGGPPPGHFGLLLAGSVVDFLQFADAVSFLELAE